MTVTIYHNTEWGTVEQAYLAQYLNIDLPFRGSESVDVHIKDYASVEVRYGMKLDLFVHECFLSDTLAAFKLFNISLKVFQLSWPL